MLNKTDKKDTEHWTPLYHAVSEGQIEIVNYLLKNKADVTVKTGRGWNVYHQAAYNDSLQILQVLIMHNNDYVNDVDKENVTPLYHAVCKDNIEIVKYLLKNEADVTVKVESLNVYHIAASNGYLQILQALIMHNNDYVNDVDKKNSTPLYHAVCKDNIEIVNYLLKNEADVTVKVESFNVYHIAANNGYLQILQALIMHNNDYVNYVSKENLTPLYHAVCKDNIEIVKYLLNNKADVTVKTDRGWNVYHLAAYNDSLQILQVLIMHNNDYVNDVDKENVTPLYHAVCKDNIEIVKYLLKNEADVTVKVESLNVYHIAASNGYLQILQALIMHNNNYVNDVDKKNSTPLYHAGMQRQHRNCQIPVKE